MKNCHTCALAGDQGDALKCGFDPKKLIAQFPMYPAFLVTTRRVAVLKDKIPAADCPAFKAPKGGG